MTITSSVAATRPTCVSIADQEQTMSKNVLLKVATTLASLLLASVVTAEDAPQLHKGPWPIRNGINYQPTENELKALHLRDVTP